jgi:hypothetical protein
MGKILSPLCCLLFLAYVASSAHADWQDQFLTEYAGASEKLENAYSRSKAAGTLARTDSKGKFLWKKSYELDRRDPAVCGLYTTISSDNSRSPVGSINAIGGTREKYFNIFRAEGERGYFVQWFGPRKDFDLDVRPNFAPLFAAYCVEDWRIPDLINDKKWILRHVQEDHLDDKDVVRVDLTTEDKSIVTWGGSVNMSIYFYLPTWTVAGWRSDSKPRAAGPPQGANFEVKLEGRVEYDKTTPIPKISVVDRWRVTPGGRVDDIRYEVTSLEFVDIAEEQFQLRRFGVEEPSKQITPGQ